MACYKPLKGFIYGKTDQGRDNIIVTSYRVDHIEIGRKGNFKKAFSRGIGSDCRVCISESIDIPCGQCLGCRLDYARQWADRCLVEMSEHNENCFVTLTYDQDNVPQHPAVDFDKDSGEMKVVKGRYNNTLKPDDLTKFIKDLRYYVNRRIIGYKELKDGSKKPIYRVLKQNQPGYTHIRYYACGEYGELYARPHYHICIFGWKPKDLSQDFEVSMPLKSELGYDYYRSKFLDSVWNKGIVVVSDCSWETCAYTARYVTKKLKGSMADFYVKNNIEKEFVRMSRKPGIGYNYIITHKDCYANFISNYLATENGSHRMNSIRFFDNYLDEMYPFDFEKIKKTRKEFNDFRKKLKQESTSLPLLDLLEQEEEMLKKRTLVLERKIG